MRVAVSQFATSSNLQENLVSCIRMINEASSCKPALIVLPEYCNSQFYNTPMGFEPLAKAQSRYADHNQAWDEALPLDGEFLQKLAQQAKRHSCYIVANVTVRRDPARDAIRMMQDGSVKSKISVTSCLFSPLGELINQRNKQTLNDHESEFFSAIAKESDIVTTPFGQLGMLAGNDSMTFEPSRKLASKGAQLLCNSISTNVSDQCKLHDSARACENAVYIATANKTSPLIPAEALQQDLEEINLGAGRSQILSPDGQVLAKMNHNKDGFIFADIDLLGVEDDKRVSTEIGFNNKVRPDGTSHKEQLRPELYQSLSATIKQTHHTKATSGFDTTNDIPVTANIAIFATYKSNEQAIEDVCHYIENNLTDIIQLPELFFIADKNITNNMEQRIQIEVLSKILIEQVSSVLRPFQYLCTSLLLDGIHQAVLINEHGLFAKQQQLHFCQRYQWTTLGSALTIVDVPLEQGNISIAMLTADDANIPEIVKIAALNGIHLLLVPFDIQEPCEVDYSLLSRATENRICIAAASREKNFATEVAIKNDSDNIYGKNKVKAKKSTGLIINLSTNSALLPQWRTRKFSGYINQAIVKLQYGKITKAVIHPIAACSKN